MRNLRTTFHDLNLTFADSDPLRAPTLLGSSYTHEKFEEDPAICIYSTLAFADSGPSCGRATHSCETWRTSDHFHVFDLLDSRQFLTSEFDPSVALLGAGYTHETVEGYRVILICLTLTSASSDPSVTLV